MKQNNLSIAIGSITVAAIFIILFVAGYTVLHQIENFFITYQGNGFYVNGFIKH
jgi:hypothetical protein